MPTEIVNSSQKVLLGRSRIFLRFCCFVLLILQISVAQARTSQPRDPVLLMRRVVVMPPLGEADALVRRWLAQDKGKPKPPRPKTSAESRSARITRLLGPKEETPEEVLVRPTPAQLKVYGEIVFGQTLTRKLHSHFRALPVGDTELQAALNALTLSRTSAVKTENATRLCAALTADALIAFSPARISVKEGKRRDVQFAVTLEMPVMRAFPAAKGESREPTVLPAARFRTTGTAGTGKKPFRAEYAATSRVLMREAARQAAARAAHTLWTGEQDPFQQEGVRIALVPAFMPVRADKLQFTAQGRQVLPASVRIRSLQDILFEPDLAPLLSSQIVAPAAVFATMRTMGLMPMSFWKPGGAPDIQQVRALGQRLKVDYVLLAEVPDVEVIAGPSEISEGQEVEAQAEAAGALLRVADGTLLWQERARAVMREKTPLSQGVSVSADEQVARASMRFALLQLQRRFNTYRNQFLD